MTDQSVGAPSGAGDTTTTTRPPPPQPPVTARALLAAVAVATEAAAAAAADEEEKKLSRRRRFIRAVARQGSKLTGWLNKLAGKLRPGKKNGGGEDGDDGLLFKCVGQSEPAPVKPVKPSWPTATADPYLAEGISRVYTAT